jgi:hypothetical protein
VPSSMWPTTIPSSVKALTHRPPPVGVPKGRGEENGEYASYDLGQRTKGFSGA